MLEKITKKQAAECYRLGQPFVMVPCKMRPDSFLACCITEKSFQSLAGEPFEYVVDAFRYYNCTTAETGRQVAFYK